jgi:hypothetical protein
MNKTNTGGPAYPAPVTKPLENYYPGISIRDYFAAKAMQTIAANPHWTEEGIAEAAYKQADAMLKAREA